MEYLFVFFTFYLIRHFSISSSFSKTLLLIISFFKNLTNTLYHTKWIRFLIPQIKNMPVNYSNKTCLLLVLISIFGFLNTQAQPETCGDIQVCFPDFPAATNIDSSANAIAYANYYNAPVEVPVVFHILHDPADNVIGQGSNVSDEAIEETLAYTNMALNGFFDDVSSVNTNIQLCLATKNPIGLTAPSIIRYSAPIYHNYVADESPQSNYESMHEFYPPWNTADYMNIWVVKDISGFIALASGPDSHGRITDRIVIEASQMNTDGGFRVLAHEIGHYFGLLHSSTLPVDGCVEQDCALEGDKVCDTPANNSGGINCIYDYYTCNGDLYYPDDFMNDGYFTCFKRFTQGQKERMRAYLIGYRPSLFESPGCSEVFANDASIWKINGIDEYSCILNPSPSITIANSGYNTITSLQISYGTDPNNLSIYSWTGNIPSGEFAYIDLPTFNLAEGEQAYYVRLDYPNGYADDEYANNELSQTVFYSGTINGFFYESMEYTISNAIYIENPDNSLTWEIAEVANCSDNANKAIKLQNWQYDNIGTEDIFTLKVNLDSFTDPYLYFDYAYSQFSPSQCENLIVSVQQECQGYYTHILFDKTQDLPTTYPPYNSYTPFSPESCDDWEEAFISLTYLKQSLSGNIYISFKSINDHGNNLYIDNLLISNSNGDYECPAPTNLTTVVEAANNVLMTWEGSPYVDYYTIEISTNEIDWEPYGNVGGAENTSYLFESLDYNGVYYVRLGAVCENGGTAYAFTNFVNNYNNCSSPDEIWVTDLGTDFITIQFTINNEINNYEIHLQEAFSSDVTIVTTNVETYTFENLNPLTQYNITIYSSCEGMLSSDSAYITATTDDDELEFCAAPTNLTVDVNGTTATINFDPVLGAFQYAVFLDDNNVGNPNNTTFELTDLTPGETYEVYVYALCYDGTNTSNGELSETIIVEIPNDGCNYVETFNHEILSPTSIYVSWQNTYEYYYIVEYRPADTYSNPNAGWSSSSTTAYPTETTLNKTISPDSCGVYEIRVKTICINGSIWDSEIITTISTCDSPPPCEAPSNLSISNVTTNSAVLDWNGPDNAWVYNLQIISDGFIVNQFLVMGSTSNTFYDLLPNTEYCVNIMTYCLEGDSNTNTFCFTTEDLPPCPPPINIEVNNITSNGADLTWEDIPDAWGYDISLTASNGYNVLSGLVFNNYYSFNNLEPNTTYTFEIASYCAPDFGETTSITFTTELPCSAPSLVLDVPFENDPDFVALFFDAVNTQNYTVYYYPTNDQSNQTSLNVSGGNVFIPIEDFVCTEYTFLVYGNCNGELSEQANTIIYQPDCEPDGPPAPVCYPPSLDVQVPFSTNPQWIYLSFIPNNTTDYQVSYKLVSSTNWEDEFNISNNTFVSLESCEEYIFYVYGVCDGELSEEATVVYYDPDCPNEDWDTNCGNAYIESFGLNTLFNLSTTDADYCYYDYTNIAAQAIVTAGSTYNVAFDPGGASQGQYWRIWIDSNNDDQFDDQDLMIYDGFNSDPYSEFTVPVTMPNICSMTTTLRVAMQTSSFGAPALNTNPTNGQIEDYTIKFADCKMNDNRNDATLFNIYPNPAQDQAFAHFEAIEEDANSLLMIYNTVGQIVQQQTIAISRNTNSIELDIDQLSPGMYVINLNTANKTYSHKLMVTE